MALRDEYRTLSAPGLDVRAAMIKQANGQALDAYELRALARRQMAERQFRASGGGTIKDSIGDLAADNPTIRLAMQRSLATARGREMGELSGRYGTDRIAQAQQVNYDALRAELERRRLSNEAAQVSNSTMAERIAADIRARELQNEARAFDNSTMAERYERETAESDVRASINKQRLDDLLYRRSLRDEDRAAEVAQRAATLRATEARALGERLRTEIDRGRLAHQAREFELADSLKERRLEFLNSRAQEPRRQSEYESLVGLYVSALSDSRDESLSQAERDEALTRAQLYKERMDRLTQAPSSAIDLSGIFAPAPKADEKKNDTVSDRALTPAQNVQEAESAAAAGESARALEGEASAAQDEEASEAEKSWFGRAADDLSNIRKAWNSGNFYSEGRWNEIAKSIIEGDSPQEREKLYQSYRQWREKNPGVEKNSTWLGSVVNGVAAILPLTVDMVPEAAAVGGAGAVAGSFIPGAGTVAGLKAGVAASVAEQSYKVGIADIYTSLRDDGIDDETASYWAKLAGVPYGAAQYIVGKFAPLSRKFLGGEAVKGLIKKISNEKIKNKILRTAAQYGADVAASSAIETASEGLQGGIVEASRQGARGQFDPAAIAQAAYAAGEAAAPGMFGMSALGVPLERALERAAGRRRGSGGNAQTASNTEAAPELTGRSQNGYPLAEGEFEVPVGSRSGQVFLGLDGELYVNDEGVRRPFLRDSDAGIAEENAEGTSAQESSEESAEAAGEAGVEGIAEREAGAEPVVEATVDEEIPAGPQEGAALGEDIADTDVQAMDTAPQYDTGFDENLEGAQGLEGDGASFLPNTGERAELLQDSAPTNREQYGTEFSPSLKQASQNNPESQAVGGENLSGRVEGGRTSIPEAIRNRVRSILSYFGTLKKGENVALEYMPVSEKTARKISEVSGGKVDARGATHVLTSNFIPHVQRRGHFEGNEFSDSLPVTQEDLANIPDIVENWDNITFRNRKSTDSITYQKGYPDGTILYVEEVWSGKSDKKEFRLASKTIYKRKGSSLGRTTAETMPYTSETQPTGRTLLNTQSQNNSESQAGNRKNISGRVGDVRGYTGGVLSEAGARLGGRGNVEAAVDSVLEQLGISDNAEARRGNSRIISASMRLLPKSVKFDRSLNRVVGTPSIADVRRYAERALGVPIAKKFRDNPKFIGIFDRKLQVIRTAGGHHNDISVLAHELGHYLDALLFDSRLEEVGGELKSELEGFAEEVFGDGYSAGEMLNEGWAEFVSRVLQNEEAAKARCPVAFALLERRLGSDLQLARVFDNIRQMVALNRGAGAWDRARANIRRRSDREKTPLSQSLKSFARTFRRRLIDSNEAIVEFSRNLSPKAGERLRAYLDNYVGGHKGQSEYSINVAQLDLDGNEIGKSLSACVNDNLSTAFERENIGAYLVARRAVAYFAKNPEDIARCREMFGLEYADCKTICEEATPGMRACASDIYQFQKNDLKMGLEAGIFSKAQYDSLMANDAYVPLQRFMEFLNPDFSAGGTGAGFANTPSPIKGFKGSDREIISPLDSIIANSARMRDICLRNRIAQNVLDGVMLGQGLGEWASPYPEDVSRMELTVDQYAKAILDSGLWGRRERDPNAKPLAGRARYRALAKIERELKKDPMLKFYVYDSEANADAKNQVVTAYVGGKKVAWQVFDKGLYEALSGMDAVASSFWKTSVGYLMVLSARTLRAGATAALSFMGSNVAVDNLVAGITSESGFVPFFSSVRHGIVPAIAKRIPKKFDFLAAWIPAARASYDEWVASGGSFSTSIENTGKDVAQTSADDILAGDDFKAHALNWLEKLKDSPLRTAGDAIIAPFEGLAQISEESTRIAEFKLAKRRAVEGGADWANDAHARRVAANKSKRITLNYARAGSWGREINMVVPFFNAAMQGLDKLAGEISPIDVSRLLGVLYGAATADPKRPALKSVVKNENLSKFLKAMAAGISAGILQEMFSSPKTDELPEWRKLRYWNFDIGGTVFHIKKPQELTPITEFFARTVNTVRAGELDVRAGEFVAGLWEALFPPLCPQFIKPWVENLTNYSMFTNSPIESASQRRLLPHQREATKTSSTAKWLSGVAHSAGVEISPIQLDNLIQGTFATLGRDVVRYGFDPIAERFGGVPAKPASSWKDITPVSAFVRSDYAVSAYVNKFYDAAGELERLYATLSDMRNGKIPKSEFTPKQKRMLIWLEGKDINVDPARSRRQLIATVKRDLSACRTIVRAVRNSTELSPQQKRERILYFTNYANNIAKTAYRILAFDEDKYKKWRDN